MIGRLVLHSDHPRYVKTFDLDGTDYRFELQWDTRTESWYYSFGTLDTWFTQGSRLTVGLLLKGVQHEALPPGLLVCYTTVVPREDPTRYSVGTTHYVAYYSLDELPDLGDESADGLVFVVTP